MCWGILVGFGHAETFPSFKTHCISYVSITANGGSFVGGKGFKYVLETYQYVDSQLKIYEGCACDVIAYELDSG